MRRLDRVEVLGHTVDVPPGVHHPAADGSSTFLYRTVGPMVAPGHRILDLGTGCGLGAIVAASRGAKVVAVDLDLRAIDAARANVEAADLSDSVEFRLGDAKAVVGEETFDQIWWNAPQQPVDAADPTRPGQAAGRDYASIKAILDSLPAWLGERGRLVISVDLDTGLGDFVRACLPAGYRSVQLASSLPVGSRFIALCVGYDLEEARRLRHEARDLQRTDEEKAAVSRKRWAGKPGADAPPAEEAGA